MLSSFTDWISSLVTRIYLSFSSSKPLTRSDRFTGPVQPSIGVAGRGMGLVGALVAAEVAHTPPVAFSVSALTLEFCQQYGQVA